MEKMMVAMSFSMVSTGASGRALRPAVPGSWMEVSGRGGGGASSMPLSFTFWTRGRMSVRIWRGENTKGSYAAHLFRLLVCCRWDDVALNTREVVGELFQNLGVSLRRRLVMT